MTEAQRGNREAYRALLDDIGPEITNFLRRRVKDAQEVADLYQETFLALHRTRHTYQPFRPVEPWLFAIAAHVVARHMGRRRARAHREILVESIPEPAIREGGQGSVELAEAFDRLPATHRQAIILLKVEGFSMDTAAARAGTTPGALRLRVHRACGALRRLLGG